MMNTVWNLYELFHTRWVVAVLSLLVLCLPTPIALCVPDHRYNLHKRAYQHRVARICEDMLTEAMVLANDHVTLPGTDGVP